MKTLSYLLFLFFLLWYCPLNAQRQEKSEKELRVLAKKGDADAQKELGNYYHDQKNYTEAFKWWKKSADQNYYKGEYNLGYAYDFGVGVDTNYAAALYWYQRSAGHGFVHAQKMIGMLYVKGGYGIKQDFSKAFQQFVSAANKNDSISQCILGEWYEEGVYVAKNEVIAERWYRRAANQNDGYGQYKLAMLYYNGTNISRDLDSVLLWLRRSSQNGYDPAKRKLNSLESNLGEELSELGRYYYEKEQYDRAIVWYSKSSNQGYIYATQTLAGMYYYGTGTAVDYNKAFSLYLKSAQAGLSNSQVMVGYMYGKGQGVKKDEKKEALWSRKAAIRCERTGMKNLASCYYNGEGVKRNYAESFSWYYRTSLMYKDTLSSNMVAYMYTNGLGVEKNPKLAAYWYDKASKQGSKTAALNLKALRRVVGNDTFNICPFAKTDIDIVIEEDTTIEKRQEILVFVTSDSAIDSVRVKFNRMRLPSYFFVCNGFEESDCKTKYSKKEVLLEYGKNTIEVIVYTAKGVTTANRSIVCNAKTMKNSNTVVSETLTSNADIIDVLPSGKRIALVIGNSRYQEEKRLNNPSADADAIASKLSRLGFEVILEKELNKKRMVDILADFGWKAKDYDVALFYYAGHGINVSGTNYIVPLNAYCPNQESVKYECVSLNYVLDVMGDCRMIIAMFDACRNNPFSRSWKVRGDESQGFVQMNSPKGTLISFSTSPGETASDGNKKHSPYAEAVLETLDIKNLSLGDFFQRVRKRVFDLTYERQVTWESNSTLGDFYFNQ